MERIGIALGSNLGDRAAHLRAARDFVFSLHQGTTPPLASPLYETEPVGCAENTPAFLNAVLEIESSLDPVELLRRLLAFEHEAGRTRSTLKNAPRPLDLDLLYVGTLHLDTNALTLPHPRLTSRRFVLQPLADIRPQLILPGQTTTIVELLARQPDTHRVRLVSWDTQTT